MICDFCSSPAPTVEYDCADFDLPGDSYRSTGGWLACADCAPLVDAANWDGLWLRFCKPRRMSPGSAASAPAHLRCLEMWKRFAELRGERRALVVV